MRQMNQPAKAQEPSMEEILASIRRIIAEGERETRDAAGAVGAASLAPDAEAAGKGLADQGEVGFYAIVFLGEQLSRPPKAGLNFVQDENHALACAKLAGAAEITLGRDDDASLALDWLKKYSGGIGRDRFLKRLDVSVRDYPEAGAKWTESLPGRRIGAEADH